MFTFNLWENIFLYSTHCGFEWNNVSILQMFPVLLHPKSFHSICEDIYLRLDYEYFERL